MAPAFLLLAALFALTSTGRVRTTDEAMTLFQVESLVLAGTTAVPQAGRIGHWYGKADREGRPRAPYPPAHAAAAAPWYALGRFVLLRLPGVPAAAADLVLGFAVTLSSAAFAAAAAAAALALFLRLGIAPRPSVGATLALSMGTPLFAYSGWFFSEPLAAALLAGAALALFGGTERRTPVAPRRAALAGTLLGLALLVRPVHAVAAVVFLAAVIVRDGRRGLPAAAALGAAFAAALVLYFARNQVLFGSPFDFGYPAAAEGGKRLNSFETPLLTGLAGFLFSPGKSLFLFAPPVAVAIIALPRLWRRDRGLAVVAAGAPLAYLLLYARYTQWEGGYCFGPRYLVPAIVLFSLALGPALADSGRRLRKITLVLVLAGAAVQSIGLATSFLEDQRHGGYYDERFDYRFDHSPLVSQARLLARYATSAEPAPIGKGFDRWFVFLRKGGVSSATLAAFALVMGGVLAASGLLLRKRLREVAGEGGWPAQRPRGAPGPSGAGGARPPSSPPGRAQA